MTSVCDSKFRFTYTPIFSGTLGRNEVTVYVVFGYAVPERYQRPSLNWDGAKELSQKWDAGTLLGRFWDGLTYCRLLCYAFPSQSNSKKGGIYI